MTDYKVEEVKSAVPHLGIAIDYIEVSNYSEEEVNLEDKGYKKIFMAKGFEKGEADEHLVTSISDDTKVKVENTDSALSEDTVCFLVVGEKYESYNV